MPTLNLPLTLRVTALGVTVFDADNLNVADFAPHFHTLAQQFVDQHNAAEINRTKGTTTWHPKPKT
jgi:hypothetical protein